MIRTATQLKARVKTRSGGNSSKAQMPIRNDFIERFPDLHSQRRILVSS